MPSSTTIAFSGSRCPTPLQTLAAVSCRVAGRAERACRTACLSRPSRRGKFLQTGDGSGSDRQVAGAGPGPASSLSGYAKTTRSLVSTRIRARIGQLHARQFGQIGDALTAGTRRALQPGRKHSENPHTSVRQPRAAKQRGSPMPAAPQRADFCPTRSPWRCWQRCIVRHDGRCQGQRGHGTQPAKDTSAGRIKVQLTCQTREAAQHGASCPSAVLFEVRTNPVNIGATVDIGRNWASYCT